MHIIVCAPVRNCIIFGSMFVAFFFQFVSFRFVSICSLWLAYVFIEFFATSNKVVVNIEIKVLRFGLLHRILSKLQLKIVQFALLHQPIAFNGSTATHMFFFLGLLLCSFPTDIKKWHVLNQENAISSFCIYKTNIFRKISCIQFST